MISLCLIIPLCALIVQATIFKHKNHPIEYVGQLGIPLVLIGVCKIVGGNIGTIDREYWGGYLTQCVFEEDWNEYIHQTCTREYPCGKGKTCTETYDCSYVAYHPDKWWAEDSNGETYPIDEAHFNALVGEWGNKKKTGHHNGYTNDGDILISFFNGQDRNLKQTTAIHSYKNKVAASNSVFNFSEVSEADIKDYGLFEYPGRDIFNTPSVLGYANSRQLDLLNAKLGKIKQVRIWVLIYNNQPMTAFEYQRNHWKNGNKNELIFGIGLKGGKVQWANVMTWCEQDEFVIRARDELAKQIGSVPDLDRFAIWLYPQVQSSWTRKPFSDFDYLVVEPPMWYVILVYFLTMASTCGLGYYFVANDVDENTDLDILPSRP